MYPTINRIADVLPAIAGRDEFVVGKRDGYQFIDYNYALPDSFDCPIRRECRGIKFDMEGKLIARPFHKFFNYHEKPHEIPDNWDDAVVMEKLDGSMIHPAMVNGELVFMTRAGVTDQAKMAMEACKRLPNGEDILNYCHIAVQLGFTPIFEFTSPHNQIVVRYSEEALTLLGVRRNTQGIYTSPENVGVYGEVYNFPVVRTFDHSLSDMNAFLHHVRELKGMEGYVVRVGQQLIKVKAEEYVAAHRAKSGLLWEKDVLRLVLEGKADDVGALLPEDEAARLESWASIVQAHMDVMRRGITRALLGRMKLPRPEFAAFVKNSELGAFSGVAFKAYDGASVYDALVAHALKQTTSTAKARAFLNSLGHVEPWVPVRAESDG